jgi:hypothetical protein
VKIVEIIVVISEPVFSGLLPEFVLGAAVLLSVVLCWKTTMIGPRSW